MGDCVHVLALAGLAPAVVTETLWAISAEGQRASGITIVTTQAAAPRVRERLIEGGAASGVARALRPHLPPAVSLMVLTDARGRPIDDIRTPEDHAACSAMLNRLVRERTRPADPPLHASLAGGRKTMAAALALAMSLQARPCDRLTHVLVDGPDAEDPDWLCPEPGRMAASVRLIDAPFPRLAQLLPPHVRHHDPEALLALVQQRLGAASPLALDLPAARLWDPAAAVSRKLSPLHAALLAMLLERGDRGVNATDLDVEQLARFYQQAGAEPDRAAELTHRLTADGATDWLREHVARLRRALAPTGIGIGLTGRRPASRYVLAGRGLHLSSTDERERPS